MKSKNKIIFLSKKITIFFIVMIVLLILSVCIPIIIIANNGNFKNPNNKITSNGFSQTIGNYLSSEKQKIGYIAHDEIITFIKSDSTEIKKKYIRIILWGTENTTLNNGGPTYVYFYNLNNESQKSDLTDNPMQINKNIILSGFFDKNPPS